MPNALLTVRCPDEIMEAIAKACGMSGQSKTDVVVNALRIGLGINPNELESIPPADVDEKIRAAIAPILAELETIKEALSLGSQSASPKAEPEPAPLLEYLESNQAIAIDTPSESIPKKTGKDMMGNHPETTIKPIAGDFSGGLTQAKLQKRLGLKHSSNLTRKKRDPEKMETLKHRDPDGLIWEWDELKELYFPVES